MVPTLETATLERETPPGSLVDLVYRNGAGETSRRRVQIVRWSHAGNGFTYLRAYCFLREEERTFRTDRIVAWRTTERASPPPASSAPVVASVPVELPRQAGATPRPHPGAPPRARGRLAGAVAVVICSLWVIRGLALDREPPADADRWDVDGWDVDSRAPAFRRATGIVDPALEALYREADRDRDGGLTWAEISAFQSRLERTCTYRTNATALRPDEFLAQGGGDCEDWALFTCGLLRYWGWDPYVGSFAGSEGGTGHAVCLVRVAVRPTRFRAWSMEADGWLGGEPVKAGWYVPIDYGAVGGLTSAVPSGWRLRVVRTPEPLYGEQM